MLYARLARPDKDMRLRKCLYDDIISLRVMPQSPLFERRMSMTISSVWDGVPLIRVWYSVSWAGIQQHPRPGWSHQIYSKLKFPSDSSWQICPEKSQKVSESHLVSSQKHSHYRSSLAVDHINLPIPGTLALQTSGLTLIENSDLVTFIKGSVHRQALYTKRLLNVIK